MATLGLIIPMFLPGIINILNRISNVISSFNTMQFVSLAKISSTLSSYRSNLSPSRSLLDTLKNAKLLFEPVKFNYPTNIVPE